MKHFISTTFINTIAFFFLSYQQSSNNLLLCSSFIITPLQHGIIAKSTKLYGQKQTRSSLLDPPSSTNNQSTKDKNINTNNTNNNENEENEEIYGAKFFGGNAMKEELFDAELEEQADKMMKLYPSKSSSSSSSIKSSISSSDNDTINTTSSSGNDSDNEGAYRRFMDKNAFPDDEARIIAQRLQSAINQVLYISSSDDDSITTTNNLYSSSLQWNTPFSKDSKSNTPLDELDKALEFYKRIDVAIIAAKNINVSSSSSSSSSSSQQMEIRWEISLLWPNVFESRVLISGTSIISVDTKSSTILSQSDKLDTGGNDGKDIIKVISPQVQPRFWDLYHIGMTPSAELMPRIEPNKSNANNNKGFLSSYDVFEIPPRLVLQPTIEDSGGRETRAAQSIPNHAFTSIIKTTGPTAQRYITTSPVEVSISRTASSSKSLISWNIPLPPEFVSFYDNLPILITDDDKAEDNEPTCNYVYQPRRLVATLKYGGYAQDVEVTEIRKKLYEQVVKDGLKPKLGEGGRPQFFFLQNDSKACFTGDGGLGMAVYEWRPKSADSNEVGIELEL